MLFTNTTLEKRPGWDWEVSYIAEDDHGRDTVETMLVFGAMTIEAAILDARSSFMIDEPCIVGARRLDQPAL